MKVSFLDTEGRCNALTMIERLREMEESRARNDEKVREYIEKRRTENIHRTIEIYARAVFEAMDNLAGDDKDKRPELIVLLFDTVRAMECGKG